MMNLLKINFLFLILLCLTSQIANAQTLKAADEGMDSFAEWATSPKVSMIEGDYNGDGKSDIALVRQTNGWGTVPIAFSNGDGGFIITNQEVSRFPQFAVNPTKVIKGDFNGDGRDDLGLLGKKGSGWGSIVIAFSNGDGTFKVTNKQADVFYQQYMSAASVTAIVGDFNGDGKDDISFFSQDSAWDTAPLAISNGDGTFQHVKK